MTWGHCHGNGEVHIILPMMMRLHRGYKTGLKVVKQLLLCFCPQDLWCVSSGHLWISCQHLPTMYLQLESKWITAQQLKVSVLTNNCLPFTLNKLPSTADCCIQHVHVTSVSHCVARAPWLIWDVGEGVAAFFMWSRLQLKTQRIGVRQEC